MPDSLIKVDTAARLNRTLGMMQSRSTVTIDICTPAGQKGKFRTTFVGYLAKQYVLLQFPDPNKLGNFGQFISKGTGVTVRGLIEGNEGAVAAFMSKIKQTLQIPSKLIVLEFPNSLSIQSLRKSIRIETDIIVKVCLDKNFWQGAITDISISGCQLLIENGEVLNMIKDKSISMVIEGYQELNNLTLNGQVCSIKQVSNGVSLGIKYNDDDKEQVVKLLHHVVTFDG